jgi:hypothetical protein
MPAPPSVVHGANSEAVALPQLSTIGTLWQEAQGAGAPAMLATALLGWERAQGGTPQQQAPWALRLAEACKAVQAHRSALRCFEHVRELGGVVQDDSVNMVRLGASRLSKDRDQTIVREHGEKGRKWITKSNHAAAFPAVQQPHWLSRALDVFLTNA